MLVLLLRMSVVALVEICIVVVLGRYHIVTALGTRVIRAWRVAMVMFVGFVMAVGGIYVFYRVLHQDVSLRVACCSRPQLTVGCACSLSPGVPAIGPMGISRGAPGLLEGTYGLSSSW
jgi:hypothetical protein